MASRKKDIVPVEAVPYWAFGLFRLLWGGSHHWPPVERWGQGYRLLVRHDFATWDRNKLTLAVFWAHKVGVRVELSPHTFKTMNLCIWKRKQVPDGEVSIMGCHPTLEQHWARVGESVDSLASALLAANADQNKGGA
jgi:hypothetical protein